MRTCKLFSAALLLLSFSLLVASQIRADEINYSYPSGGNTFTWTLPTNPVIAPGDASASFGFTIPNWSFSENGAPMVGTLEFFSTSAMGGFQLFSGVSLLINAQGDQLYSGPESAPTMLTGSFATVDFGSDTVGFFPPIPVTLSPSVSPVPEPSTLSLWAIGLALGLTVTFVRKRLA
jgi:PEP-CTERM motif-containing protein